MKSRFHAATAEIMLSIQECFQQTLKTAAFARDTINVNSMTDTTNLWTKATILRVK